MSWVLDGERITADYCGHIVTGVVIDSRVKYGGNVQYTVNLDKPVNMRWRPEPVYRVLVDRNQLIMEMV